VARPSGSYDVDGGSVVWLTAVKYFATAALCQLASGDCLMKDEKPPPEPNWSVAISGWSCF
jgi:hypothetical protein